MKHLPLNEIVYDVESYEIFHDEDNNLNDG